MQAVAAPATLSSMESCGPPHGTRRMVGVVDWLASVFAQPLTLTQPARPRRRPQITAGKENGSSKRKPTVSVLVERGQWAQRGIRPRGAVAQERQEWAGLCPLHGHRGPALPV